MKVIPSWILAIAGIGLMVFIAWYFSNIIAYLLIAGVLSLIGKPIVHFYCNLQLGRFRLSRTMSAVLGLLTIYLIFLSILALFIPLVIEQAKIIASINVKDVYRSLQEPLAAIQEFLNKYQISDNPDQTTSQYIQQKLMTFIQVTDVTNIFNTVLGMLGNVIIAIFSVTFILFFFLKEEGLSVRIILTITPTRYEKEVTNILSSAKYLLTRYFTGILIQVTLITLIVSLGMSIIGIDNALLIGFFAGIINIIPYVGPIIGALFGIVIGITSNLHLDFYSEMIPLVLKMLPVFVVVQLADNFLFQPLIFSSSVKAHPLEIFIVILAAASIGGVAGMILAIPCYTILRVVAREFFSQFKLVKELTGSIGKKR